MRCSYYVHKTVQVCANVAILWSSHVCYTFFNTGALFIHTFCFMPSQVSVIPPIHYTKWTSFLSKTPITYWKRPHCGLRVASPRKFSLIPVVFLFCNDLRSLLFISFILNMLSQLNCVGHIWEVGISQITKLIYFSLYSDGIQKWSVTSLQALWRHELWTSTCRITETDIPGSDIQTSCHEKKASRCQITVYMNDFEFHRMKLI